MFYSFVMLEDSITFTMEMNIVLQSNLVLCHKFTYKLLLTPYCRQLLNKLIKKLRLNMRDIHRRFGKHREEGKIKQNVKKFEKLIQLCRKILHLHNTGMPHCG